MSALSKVFVINSSGEIVPKVNERETIRVCPWCYNEAYSSRIDGLDMCRECGCIEGQAKTITLAEWLEEHG